MLKDELKVPVEKLRLVFNPKDFAFKDTSEVTPIKGFIGQERAVEAIRFGLEVNNREYNIFVTGHTGKGKKKDVLHEFVEEFTQEKAALGGVSPQDVCYVFNFENPNQPKIVFFTKGGGIKFKMQMAVFLANLVQRNPTARRINHLLKNLYKEYEADPKIIDYLDGLTHYILSGINLFQKGAESGADYFLPFAVNLFVDNSAKTVSPVIFEGSPDFHDLFYEIRKEFAMGGYFTDHTHLKAGSLALANGGYLILNQSIFENPGCWQKLKKTLKQGTLTLEEPFYGLQIASLDPEPMPISLKVIIIGEAEIYQLLMKYDHDFRSMFKVKAELDSEMPLIPDNKKKYAGFISACCQKENLLPFDSTGVAKMVEHGARLAESQIRLSTKLDEIKDVAIEANYWAKKLEMPHVQSAHVQKALESQRMRRNLMEEKTRAAINRGTILISTEGQEIGQINSLFVWSLGDYSFGTPVRVTAKTFAGSQGVLSIQRETKMSGPLHDAGIFTLNAYFREEYGKYRPVNFSASISFEQCYEGMEGPSATAAEIFCLISSLSDLPISQSFAVTGAVNQNGEIQPIGGVNEKIEGFFDVCKERGFTGEQGVVIPRQNTQDLMLREDVVSACAEGKFRIYAIENINDGLEILMGVPAKDIRKKVKERLQEMTERSENK